MKDGQTSTEVSEQTELRQAMADYVLGMDCTDLDIINYFDLPTHFDVESALLAVNVERCSCCEQWFGSSELVHVDGEATLCVGCSS